MPKKPPKPSTAKPAGPRFGAHMSVAGGLHLAFEHAQKAGCDCLQVFVKNQRQWKAAPLSDEVLAAWHDVAHTSDIRPVVAHATYLINLASPDKSLWAKSIDAFVVELRRCGMLGISGLVLHPGSHLGAGEAAGCARISKAIDRIADQTADLDTEIWLELTAGQGTCLGCRFEHIGDIIAATRGAARIGVCFDTCHALAAGYRFDTAESYAETFSAFDRHVGLDRLRCFHMNDSKRELGSRVDRHTHIGKGYVGRAAFRLIVNDARFRQTPMILETPKGTDPRGRVYDRINLAALRRLVNQTASAAPRVRRRAAIAATP